jgi:phosphoribosylglycinamide formyltransferase-1
MNTGPISVVVLISGRGSNLAALVDARRDGHLNIDIKAVISNTPDAAGLQLASDAGIACAILPPSKHPDREEYDQALSDLIAGYMPDLVVLAGFMRILSPGIAARFAGRMINIHPSLLPRYRGLHTHQRVLEAGDQAHGASIHFVTAKLDGGPVISQVRIAVIPGETADALAARLLPYEHQLMITTMELFASGRVTLNQQQIYLDGDLLRAPMQLDETHATG